MEKKKFYEKGVFWGLVLFLFGMALVLLEVLFKLPQAIENYSSWGGYGFVAASLFFGFVMIRSWYLEMCDGIKRMKGFGKLFFSN